MARRRALKTVQLLCGFSAQPTCLPAIERSHQYQLASRLAPGAGYATVAPLPREQLSAAQGYGFAAAAIVQPPVATDSASDLYSIKVVTGNLRGAGTPSAAKVQLVGSISASEPVLIGTDELGTLDRGSTRTIAVPVPRAFGTLRRVHVEKAHPVAGDGWYLKHIEVSMPGGDTVLFPCDAWLGDSDCGGYNGPSERNLLPAVPSLSVEDPTPVRMVAAGVAIPHPEKVLKNKIKGHNTKGFGYGGEDAYYYVDNGKGLFSMGVADGVYQWREHGIDPGEMSRALMEVCSKQVLAGEEDVFKIFNRAVDHMHKMELKGSTTVCLISINQVTGQLHSVNLGDSGFLVFTPSHGMGYDLKFRTNQLEHSFGCPFQIGHHKAANKVPDSDLASFHLFPGDVIVMGSDGLLDNVTDLEMATEVAEAMRQNASPSQIAHRLTKLAFDTSLDKKRVTPYSKGASEAFDMIYSGGKPDDITVLVAVAK